MQGSRIVAVVVVVWVASPAFAVNVGPPLDTPDETWAHIQALTDDPANEGRTLLLEPGAVYDFGENVWVIRQALTVVGQTDENGVMSTIVSTPRLYAPNGDVFLWEAISVTLFEDHADDRVTFRNLKVETDLLAFFHAPYSWGFDSAGELETHLYEGGGDLVIRNCDVYADFDATVVSARGSSGSLEIRRSALESGGSDAIVVAMSVYESVDIRDNVITSPHDGIEIVNVSEWRPWQNPLATGPTWIKGNDIDAGRWPAPWLGQPAIALWEPYGSVFVRGNTLRVPGSEDPDHNGAVALGYADSAFSSLDFRDNLLIGGEEDDGKFRLGLDLQGSLQDRYTDNEFVGYWSTGVEMLYGSENEFRNTDFSQAHIAASPPDPAVHWLFWGGGTCPWWWDPEWGCDADTSDNIVHDDTGMLQFYLDYGENNTFRGDSTFESAE